MSHDKDPWGDKLRAATRAHENQYFAKIDQELIAKLKETAKAREKEDHGDCPRCSAPLRAGTWRDLDVEFCPSCGGLWLDPGDLLSLAHREDVSVELAEKK